MRFWEVKIDCWRPGKRGQPNIRVQRRFIVEAEDGQAAMEMGRAHADRTADFGADWLGFDARSAASVALPFEVKE